MAFDSFGQVMDTMDLVKRAWSSLNVPTPFTPTLSVEEIDKRITDLRAVEQWLSLNQNLLRTTIQGLEIQRGTLTAMNALSDSFGKAVQPDDTMAQALAQFAAAAAARHGAEPAGRDAGPAPAATGWPNPFFYPSAPAPASASPVPAAAPAAASAPAPASAHPEPDDEGVGAADPDASASAKQPDTAASPAPAQVDLMQAAAINPMAWWNLLQNNFQQIADAATSGATPPAPAPSAGPKPAGKPRKRGRQAASPAATRPASGAKKAAAKGPRRRAPTGES